MPQTVYKNNLKQVKNPQVIAKSVRLLEENIGGNLYDHLVRQVFLNMTQKTKTIKEKQVLLTSSNLKTSDI